MRLIEAIKHCEEKAEELRETAKSYPNYEPYDKDHCACLECAREHEQLAEWLRDYKRLLEEQRPKGEWKMNKTSVRGRNYTCNTCHKISRNKFCYCPNCGADMRKGADNE